MQRLRKSENFPNITINTYNFVQPRELGFKLGHTFAVGRFLLTKSRSRCF